MGWLEQTIERWGEPRLVTPEGTSLVTDHGRVCRRAWVWFPGGSNHGLRIDTRKSSLDTSPFITSAWSHKLSSHIEFISKEEPTEEEIAVLTELAWGLTHDRA